MGAPGHAWVNAHGGRQPGSTPGEKAAVRQAQGRRVIPDFGGADSSPLPGGEGLGERGEAERRQER